MKNQSLGGKDRHFDILGAFFGGAIFYELSVGKRFDKKPKKNGNDEKKESPKTLRACRPGLAWGTESAKFSKIECVVLRMCALTFERRSCNCQANRALSVISHFRVPPHT